MLFKRIKILYWQNQFWFIVVLAIIVLGAKGKSSSSMFTTI